MTAVAKGELHWAGADLLHAASEPESSKDGAGSGRAPGRDAMTLDDLAQLWAAGATFADMARKLGESRSSWRRGESAE
jgi:hypothetical protein